MSLFQGAVKLLKSATSYFKKDGYTDEEIVDGFEYAEKMLSKMKLNMSDEDKESILKAFKEVKKQNGGK